MQNEIPVPINLAQKQATLSMQQFNTLNKEYLTKLSSTKDRWPYLDYNKKLMKKYVRELTTMDVQVAAERAPLTSNCAFFPLQLLFRLIWYKNYYKQNNRQIFSQTKSYEVSLPN